MSDWYTSTRYITFCLVVAGIAAGCGLTAPRPESAALDVQGAYIGAAAAFGIRNLGNQVVFVSRCGERVLSAIDRRVGNEWVNAAAAICPANLPMAPIRVEPGNVLRDSVAIPVTGTYRLRVTVMTGSPSAVPESIASPSFAIE